MSPLLLVLLGAILGGAVGAAAPELVRRLPEPLPDEEEDTDPVDEALAPPAEPEQPKIPYVELANRPGLRLRLGIAGAVVLAVIAWARGAEADLAAFWWVAALGVVAAWVDVQVHRLPDRLTFPAFGGGAVLLAVAAAVEGEWGWYLRAFLGALALFAFYFVLALIRPRDMGFGDVKLAAVLGLGLGWLGWGEVVTGAFLGFLFGGLSGLLLIVGRRAGLRTHIPFGPFMMVGALVAVIWGETLVDFYLGNV